MHLVQVNLSAPGIELYVTEVDPVAVQAGYSYRLRHAAEVLEQENLAVVINAALFESASFLWPRVGDLATSSDTLISNHRVSSLNAHSYLLGFDDRLTPRLETEKPPSRQALARARWGVAGQGIALKSGEISSFLNHIPDRRTAIGIDAARQWLVLAVFEQASERCVAEVLAEAGAQDGLLLDGGHSTTMVVDSARSGRARQTLLGGMWPVATFFGVRASSSGDAMPR